MSLSPSIKQEPVAETSSMPDCTQLTAEQQQALEQSECNPDKCEEARCRFYKESILQGDCVTLHTRSRVRGDAMI